MKTKSFTFTLAYIAYLMGVFFLTLLTLNIHLLVLQILATLVALGYIVTGMVSLQRYYEKHF